MSEKDEKIVVENVNTPGKTSRVNAEKYTATKTALLRILPKRSPGITQKEMMENIKAELPQSLFPNGEKSGWWMKTVQLDLEAKGLVARESTKPLRWHLT